MMTETFVIIFYVKLQILSPLMQLTLALTATTANKHALRKSSAVAMFYVYRTIS